MFNRHDTSRDAFMLEGKLAGKGYDWWWHSFTARDAETGERKPFFIEFFLCNPALGGDKPIFGQRRPQVKKGKKPAKRPLIQPSYLMVKVGTWGVDAAQLHKFWGWHKVEYELGVPFSISAGECFLSEGGTHGCIRISEEEASAHREWMCQAGEMSWSLTIDKKVAFNVGYGASAPLRRLAAFEMFWHAEGMKTAYKGEVTWNGRRYLVNPNDCNGYADKNWGSDFTSPWIWLSSGNLTSMVTGKRLRNSVFDIGGGRPRIGPFALKGKLLSAIMYEGRQFEFNFSKFWTLCRTRFDCREGKNRIVWHIEQKTLTSKMIVDMSCPKRDMLLVNYESPDGARRHDRLWNGGTGRGTIELYHMGKLVDRIKVAEAGCEWGEYGSERNRNRKKNNKRKKADDRLQPRNSNSGESKRIPQGGTADASGQA